MRIRRRDIAAALALLTSCAHPLPPLQTTKLYVEEHEGGYRAIVHAFVAGKRLSLVLDTGADKSILPEAFVRKARLQTILTGDDYIDANGHLFTMHRVHDVPLQFEGEKLAGKLDFLSNPALPEDVGILAPQTLVASGWALTIDLEHGELRYDPEDAALERLRTRGAAVRAVDFHSCLIEGLFNRAHRVVDVKVNGVPTALIIDSGAELTALARNNAALPSMLKTMGGRQHVGGLGSLGQGLVVDDVPLEFAGTAMKTTAMVLPASQICGQGLLGANVLHQCTLVWGARSLWASCVADPTAAAR